MALLPSFCFSAAFLFKLVSTLGALVYFSFVRIWLVSTNKSITRGKYGHFNWHQMLLYSRLYQVS